MTGNSPPTSIVITGRKRGGPRQMAAYLMDKGENETIRVRHIGGYIAKTVQDALAEMWAVAEGTKTKDFLYHATINPRPGVTLSQKQWQDAVNRLEKNLNLTGHQRVVVEHVKKDRTHYHIVWNRTNPHTGRTKKLSFDRRTLRATALQLGQQFKLTATSNKGQSFKRGDIERGKRTGIDPKIVKAEVTALWNQSKSGQEFVVSLTNHGYILARGDRNQFVLIDRAGSIHGLTRSIQGATAKTIKRGLADIDAKALPTITEAKAQVRAKWPKHADKGTQSIRLKRSEKRQLSTGSWSPYAFFVMSGHANSALERQQKTFSSTATNKTTAITTVPHEQSTEDKRQNTIRQQKLLTAKTEKTPSSNITTTSPKNKTSLSNRKFENGGTLPPISNPFVQPLVASPFRTAKEERTIEQSIPVRPVAHGGMSQAQLTDLKAAQEGKITWAEYFQKWGRGGLVL